uniref:Ribosome biogenesis protein NSA2 homolog n=1 Tax=Trieres chinensis TaxID=1514140 RepID=A0A7S2EES3_TRICV|mmetsp:Transcript_19661/g.39856  ORF Transcript_19661/g.39856 Transcript_19661/m.39856 type:complete len:261 (+) Transcript_19661:227-1009(+)
MPQHEHMERHRKLHGRRFDAAERERKREARLVHKRSEFAQKVHGLRAKLYNERRFKEKATMRKTISKHDQRNNKHANDDKVAEGAVPAYLLDREGVSRAKVLSNTVKQKRKDKAGKWEVPIPRVKPVADDEMFKVMRTGSKKAKAWKRVVTKCTFVGENFTRKPPKYERFIRPTGLRMKKANVTHPELKTTFQLDILSVKKNPSSALYTNLGVVTKGTVIEVNVSDLGLVTTSGKVAWAKFAQITNNPELDGCVNAVLLV